MKMKYSRKAQERVRLRPATPMSIIRSFRNTRAPELNAIEKTSGLQYNMIGLYHSESIYYERII